MESSTWTVQRKIASYEFNTGSLKHFISDVVKTEMIEIPMPYLSKAWHDNSIFDLQEVMGKFTFSTICKIAFGVDPASSKITLTQPLSTSVTESTFI